MRLLIVDGPSPGVQLDPGDPELRLTQDQRRALTFDREVVVTAGAGAGKTHTLSLRFVALMLHLAHSGLPEPDAVLVLTFTEKAAEEMAERCYRRLLSLGEALRARQTELDALPGPGGQPLGRHLAHAIDRLVDRFDAARIGTFHGFCARLLREFPAATGTAPGTVVLDAAEARERVDRAVDRAFRALLSDRPDDLPVLLDAFGSRAALLTATRAAVDGRITLQQPLTAHAAGQVTLEGWIAQAPVSPQDALAWLRSTGWPALDALWRLTRPSGGGPAVARLPELLARRGETPPEDPVEQALWTYARYREVTSALLTGDGRLRRLDHHSVLGTRAAWTDARRYAQAKAATQVLAQRLADVGRRARLALGLPVAADRLLLEALRPFGQLALDAIQHLERILAEERAVDFTTLQLRAVRAVRQEPELRRTLQQRHRYLMVDEFQDTDALQWELVRALGRPDGAPADRIFLVGDAKQAIYGFRGGDVTLFRAATAELGAEPVILGDNFRSRPELIDWFNQALPRVLAPVGPVLSPWEAHYEPLRAGRADPGGSVTALVDDRADQVAGREPSSHASFPASGVPWEPDAVAHLIRAEMLADRGPYAGMALADRERHPLPPIAILLRARTGLPLWEEALRRLEIPYVVAAGVGFWARQEVLDLVNALHALATDDPVSGVGVLRSPLLALTDDEVQELQDGRAFADPEGPLGLVGLTRRPLRLDVSPRLHAAQGRWRRFRALRHRLPLTDLLRELAAAGLYAWRLQGGAQAEANVLRLIRMAARLEERGTDGPTEAAERFLALVEAHERESEASVAPDRARVVLMTIHASKGLEFPVVIVPSLHQRPRSPSDPLLSGRLDGETRVACQVPDPEAEVQTRTRPGLLEALLDRRKAEEHAEYRRLFYVAATRARDHLVISGHRPTSDPEERVDRASLAELLLTDLPASTRILDRRAVEALPLPALPPAPPPEPPTAAHAAALTPLVAPETVELTASSLDLFASCPARWYRRHRAGIPEATWQTREHRRALAAARGEVLHSLLEDGLTADREAARARWTARALTEGATPDEAEALLPRLFAHLDAIQADPHLARVMDAPGQSEVGFQIARGELVLRGSIDRLYQGDDGWVALDWKSEALDGRPPEIAAHRHRLQLHAYRWAAGQLLEAPVRAEVYFTELGAAVRLDELDDAALEALLDEVRATARQSWRVVERRATDGSVPRPCATCGYLKQGCRGAAQQPVRPDAC